MHLVGAQRLRMSLLGVESYGFSVFVPVFFAPCSVCISNTLACYLLGDDTKMTVIFVMGLNDNGAAV